MKSSLFPLLNALGCLLLTVLVIIQWNHERALNHSLTQANTQISRSAELIKSESARAATLERDITVLKESLKATQESAERSAVLLEEKQNLATQLQTELSAAREQVTTWQTALAQRDTRLQELSNELSATRSRLDKAIAQLKAAAAQ